MPAAFSIECIGGTEQRFLLQQGSTSSDEAVHTEEEKPWVFSVAASPDSLLRELPRSKIKT